MELQTYRLLLSYDGTRYRGWQRLATTNMTLQGKLEEVLSELLAQPIEVSGSGRTDAGVHAVGQVVSFRGPKRDCARLLRQLRKALPEDMGACALEPAADRFHARLNATRKTYVYRIWNSEEPDVFLRRFRLQVPQALDMEAMRQGAALLCGTHDFLAFCSNKHYKKSSLRTLFSLELEQKGAELTFTLTADGFLYHMARILVGTLLELGLGSRQLSQIPLIFQSRRRELAGETVPAKGLCLMEVCYE